MLKLKVKRKGGASLDAALKKLEQVSKKPNLVKVGIPDSSINYPDGTNLLMVAAVNEFGSLDGRIPERSYLRSTMINKRDVFKKFWRKYGADYLTGKIPPRDILELLGQLAQAEVQRQIRAIDDPPNALSTIEQKGSSKPLIDSGLLIQSIRYQVNEK
jgi:hypothetical protein